MSPKNTAIPGQRSVTWLVVADGERARIYRRQGHEERLGPEAVEELSAANLADRELGTDRPGNTRDRVGFASHALTPKTSAHRHEKESFARRLAGVVNHAAREHRFDRLVVVAPPQALGDLRSFLEGHAQALLVAEVVKDLTHVPSHELLSHLEETMV
jgi:protein required for attachment to host cells